MEAATHPRVVLTHDWLTGMRGGEKCLEVLCHRWPQARLYTLLHRAGSVADVIELHHLEAAGVLAAPNRRGRLLRPTG